MILATLPDLCSGVFYELRLVSPLLGLLYSRMSIVAISTTSRYSQDISIILYRPHQTCLIFAVVVYSTPCNSYNLLVPPKHVQSCCWYRHNICGSIPFQAWYIPFNWGYAEVGSRSLRTKTFLDSAKIQYSNRGTHPTIFLFREMQGTDRDARGLQI